MLRVVSWTPQALPFAMPSVQQQRIHPHCSTNKGNVVPDATETRPRRPTRLCSTRTFARSQSIFSHARAWRQLRRQAYTLSRAWRRTQCCIALSRPARAGTPPLHLQLVRRDYLEQLVGQREWHASRRRTTAATKRSEDALQAVNWPVNCPLKTQPVNEQAVSKLL